MSEVSIANCFIVYYLKQKVQERIMRSYRIGLFETTFHQLNFFFMRSTLVDNMKEEFDGQV